MQRLLMNHDEEPPRIIWLMRTAETQLNQEFPGTDELRVIGAATFPPRFARESAGATL